MALVSRGTQPRSNHTVSSVRTGSGHVSMYVTPSGPEIIVYGVPARLMKNSPGRTTWLFSSPSGPYSMVYWPLKTMIISSMLW